MSRQVVDRQLKDDPLRKVQAFGFMRQTSTNVWAISNKCFSRDHPDVFRICLAGKRIIEPRSFSTLEDFAKLVMLDCSSKIISESCFGGHDHPV